MRDIDYSLTRKQTLLYLFIFVAILLFVIPCYSQTDERIISFHSDITIQPDGMLSVIETIKVHCNNEQINHGIYRDFPTLYKDNLHNRYKIEFKLKDIKRDGQPDDYHFGNLSNGIRIYIGKKDITLTPGDYTYTIAYQVSRVLGFFKDHDELYWNVTGNGWTFQIENASATVHLPADAQKNILIHEAYTGPKGAKGNDYTYSIDTNGNPVFTTTKPLDSLEGITIVVGWPKGFVKEPTQQEKMNLLLKDNLHIIIGIVGFIILLVYYIIVWTAFGRDPKAGTIIPLYSPPKDLSPAAIRYITKMHYDSKAFAANILDMAVKRYITINENKGVYTLNRKEDTLEQLTVDERQMALKLIDTGHSVEMKQENHTIIADAIKSLKTYLKTKYETVYFITNIKYFIVGALISILILGASGLDASIELDQTPLFLFITVWLTFWSLGVTFLLKQVIQNWKVVFFGNGSRILAIFPALFMTAFSLPFMAGECFGLYMLGQSTSFVVIGLLIILVFVNYLFYELLKAPTLAGRQILDQIEGFKLYLTVAEKDQMNVMNPPNRTPALFEKYLPYALALDVEQQWAEKFSDVLAQASKSGEVSGYHPYWYSGPGFSKFGATGFASSFGNSLAGAISSSSTAPGSSSGGGGGGSSGGGGGGGGGGGW